MDRIFGAIRSVVLGAGSADRLRVLVVEDNADLARVIAMLLRHCGFDVKVAHDGRLVLSVARAFRPHFILLDIGLPGLDGFEVAEQLRGDREFEKAVIIAVTAHGPDVLTARCPKRTFDHHLIKPVGFDDLLAVMIPRR